MATLIFDEQFPDKDIRQRGWDRDAGEITGTTLVHDEELGKNVIYHSWSNGKRGLPDGPGDGAMTFGHSISSEDWNRGVTFYTVMKFHNYIFNGSGGLNHAPLRANPTGYMGNGSGEYSLDPMRNGTFKRANPDLPSNQIDYAPTGRFFTVQFDASSAIPNNNTGTWVDMTHLENDGSFLEDDVWYEVVQYLYTNNGGSGQEARAWWRRYGEEEWKLVHDWRASDGYRFITTASTNPYVGLGPYLHSNSLPNEQPRVYTGWLTVWSGDAMADGQIGGKPSEPTDPVEPPVEPSDPLSISDFKVVPTNITAEISWTTNKEANTVVDYGPTPDRGAVARGESSTTEHSVTLTDLTPETTYYYRFSSRTADGESVFDPENSTFTTTATEVVKPPVEPSEPELVEHALDEHIDAIFENPEEGQVVMYQNGYWRNVDAKPMVAALVEEILGKTTLVVTGKKS